MDQEEFFKFLWDGQEGITNFFFKKGEDTKTRHYPFPNGLEQMVSTVEAANEAGYECYFAPALLTEEGRKKKNFKLATVAWADFDSPPNGSIEPHPTLIVETSPGHIHTYWKLETPLSDSGELEQINKHLAHHLGADDCWDATRLLRVPGTNNYKRDGHEVSIVLHNDGVHTFAVGSGDVLPKHKASLWRLLYYRSQTIQDSPNSYLREVRGIARLRSINSQPYWEKEEFDMKLLRRFSVTPMKGGGSSSRGATMKLVSRIFSKPTKQS